MRTQCHNLWYTETDDVVHQLQLKDPISGGSRIFPEGVPTPTVGLLTYSADFL